MGEDSKARQLRKFARLHKTQNPTTKTSKERVISLSGHTLDDGVSSLLQKGLNDAVTPSTIPIEDILAGVEKALQSLHVEMAEKARQETVRIIRSSSRPTDNLTRAEKEALRTILPADKGNATVILNTVYYKQKTTSLLEYPSCRRLARDPINSTERKTTLLLKKSTLTEDICKQLRPAGSRPPRMYGIPEIHKEGGGSAETHCQQHWRSYLPTLRVLSRTS